MGAWLAIAGILISLVAMIGAIAFGIVFGLGSILAGLPKYKVLQASTNWIPSSYGGPLEIRPLPDMSEIDHDWETWGAGSTQKIGRLYEVTLANDIMQQRYRSEISRHDTPLGRPWYTVIQFDYVQGPDRRYQFSWQHLGKQDTNILRVVNHPRRVLVSFYGTNSSGIPLLSVRAIEGVEPMGQVWAESREATPSE